MKELTEHEKIIVRHLYDSGYTVPEIGAMVYKRRVDNEHFYLVGLITEELLLCNTLEGEGLE